MLSQEVSPSFDSITYSTHIFENLLCARQCTRHQYIKVPTLFKLRSWEMGSHKQGTDRKQKIAPIVIYVWGWCCQGDIGRT